jgi:hypothetical protein
MNNGKSTDDVKCELHQLERNRYFYGKLMTVRDFETEQRYFREHRHLHNQSLHGWGVVCGLTVEPKGGTGNATKVVVKPGVALDCCGREIVLAKDQELDLSNFLAIGTVGAPGKNIYLCIRYDECSREPVPALANVSTCEEACDYNRIQEKIAFDVLTELPQAPVSQVCETWMNLTIVRSEIDVGGTIMGEFERIMPRWVRQGDVFEVRRKLKLIAGGQTIRLEDALPAVGYSLLDGSLVMEITNSIEGKLIQTAYLVKVQNNVTPRQYQITGQVFQSPPEPLPSSTVEVISSTKPLEEQVQEKLFTQEFEECPSCANGHNSRCVVLARIALQQQGSSFIVAPINGIDNFTFDMTRGIYRRLVYPTPLMVELLECLRKRSLEQPVVTPQLAPHHTTHENNGSDEINVTDLSGVLADAQKVRVQAGGTVIGTRRQLNFINPGFSVSDDPNNDRVNINVGIKTGFVRVQLDDQSEGRAQVDSKLGKSPFCVYLGVADDNQAFVEYGNRVTFSGQPVDLTARVQPTGIFEIDVKLLKLPKGIVGIRWFVIPGVE